MDAGPIYAQKETQIDPQETAGELKQRLAKIGSELVCKTLNMLESDKIEPYQQDESKVTLAPKLKKSDGHIDFTAPAEKIRNLVHGTFPWPGGKAIIRRKDGSEVQLTLVRVSSEKADSQLPPGTVDGELMLATGNGRLRIKELKPAGKKLISWRDFVNGYHVCEGDFFRPLNNND